MLHLIPRVKCLDVLPGTLEKRAISCDGLVCDGRVRAALDRLPQAPDGVPVTVTVTGDGGEGYELWVEERAVRIEAPGPAGAFYAVQTLRQIFTSAEIPCLHIKDEPDFAYRGFYQDETRGRVHTLATLKELIDRLAYFKYNSLQLYVEHTFSCEEYADVIGTLGYLTDEELQELDAYCKRNFIDFIPSLATFGHLYDLLHQPKYRHLCMLRDEEDGYNYYQGRHTHHTIDPLVPESIRVIRHLIDQYAPHFTGEWFNICCDETFDLNRHEDKGYDTGRLYLDFVKKIIDHVSGRGKKVMMWADVLLQHPEVLQELPEDTCFLNWYYDAPVKEERIAKLAHTRQILCPGTSTWWRFCENVDVSRQNIAQMAEYGKKYGAIGLLNTNWGDFGNPATIDLAMFGVAAGAEKAWSAAAPLDEAFDGKVNHLVYENENGVACLTELSRLQSMVRWQHFCDNALAFLHGDPLWHARCVDDREAVQQGYAAFAAKLSAETWKRDNYRLDMLVAAQAVCLTAELSDRIQGIEVERVTDTEAFLREFRARWLLTTKESELFRIERLLRGVEEKL